MGGLLLDLYDLVFNYNPHPTLNFFNAINYTKDCWDDLFTFLRMAI